MRTRAAILGSNSFAGSWIVNRLLSTDFEVLGISRSEQSDQIFNPYLEHPKIGNFQFRRLHILKESRPLLDCLDNFEPNIIIDLAGQGMVAESWSCPEDWFQTNVIAKVRLHTHLKDKQYLQKYIRVSTPEVYGKTLHPIVETNIYHPSTPYAVSHAAIDLSLNTYFKNYDFPVILTRFSNFYGPHQQLYRIIPKTFLSALTRRSLTLHGGGSSIRSFIHGDDVSSALLKTAQMGVPGETYHFSDSEFISIRDLIYKIAHSVGVDPGTFVTDGPDRPGKDQVYMMDATKAGEALGWTPRYTLSEGIEQTRNWVLKNFEQLKGLSWEYSHIQ